MTQARKHGRDALREQELDPVAVPDGGLVACAAAPEASHGSVPTCR